MRKKILKRAIGNFVVFTLFVAFLFVLAYFLDFCKNQSTEIYFSKSAPQPTKTFPVVSGVIPHHLSAKDIALNFFNYISSKESPKVIVLLSSDYSCSKSLCASSSFISLDPETDIFKQVKVARSLLKELSLKTSFCFDNSALEANCRITNLLPYIKRYFPEAKVLPVLISSNILEDQIASLIKNINSKSEPETLVIADVDFSRDLPPLVADFHDLKSIRVVLNFERDNFRNIEVGCWQCLYGARLFARLRGSNRAKIIAHKNSCDLLKDRKNSKFTPCSEATSYYSVVFEEDRNEKKEEYLASQKKVKTLLFVGDIMLDRGVEKLMERNGFYYPFQKISQLLRGVDIVVGNLEGPIVRKPVSFPASSLRFAFKAEVAKVLSFFHFNLVSLANNHTLDVGKRGFEETKKILKDSRVDFIGHPVECEEGSFLEKDGIVFLAFNKTFSFNCSDEQIARIVKNVRELKLNRPIIVLIHWGDEYKLKSNFYQRKLAHRIIDAGADLIIGTHPHVVEEIEEYKGRLIFYSLGNFIFDQYFSEDTQKELVVGLEVYPNKFIYRLFPVKSKLSCPSLMLGKERETFLRCLSERSSPSISKQIIQAKISLIRE